MELRTFVLPETSYQELPIGTEWHPLCVGVHAYAQSTAPAIRVLNRLRPSLTTLMGTGGFRTLLLRALVLSTREIPWLEEMEMKTDGSLERGEQRNTNSQSDDLLEGHVVLLAQLLALLVAFIGEILTLRLIKEIWPKFSLNNLELDNETDNENVVASK